LENPHIDVKLHLSSNLVATDTFPPAIED